MSNFPNQATVYLEGNPVKLVSLLTGNATPQNSPKVINGSEREQIMLCDPLTGLPLDLEGGGGGGGAPPSDATPLIAAVAGAPGTAALYARGDHVHPLGPLASTTPLAASGTGTVGTGTTAARADHVHPIGGGGIPVPVATAHVFANVDNTEAVIAIGTPNYVLNTGLTPGWGVSVKGAFTLTGTATVTDDRATTGTAWCCIAQTDTAGTGLTYDLVGTK